MIKKTIATLSAAVMLFGAAALLPENDYEIGTRLKANARYAVSGYYDDFAYLNIDPTHVKISYYTGNDSKITIPSSINGMEVTTIGESAFDGGACYDEYTSIKSIIIPNSVTTIEDHAFRYLKNLESVTIPDSVTETGYGVFSYSPKLKKVTLPKNLTNIEVSLLAGCESLEKVSIPNGVKSIGEGAFQLCKKLDNVVIPNSVKRIEKNAFYGCAKLSRITIPNSVTSISQDAFYVQWDEWYGRSLIILGTKGSYAEKYAKEHENEGITFCQDFGQCSATIPYSSYTYRGRGIKPTVTVKNNAGTKLKKDTDYTVSYSGNTNAGTATISVKGKGSYTGSLKKTFTVKALDLTSSYAKVGIPYSAYTYTGSAIKPAVTVKFKDGDVIPADQYTVSYSNNTKVGTATITVKGKTSNVTGTYKKTFVVKPAKNEITSISTTSGAFKIKWKKGTAGTVGYQVLYSQDKAALNAASGEVKNSSAKKYVHSYTSTNLSDLSESFSTYPKSGETWYVKVRSFYTKDGKTTSTRYGNYSAVKSIKVK